MFLTDEEKSSLYLIRHCLAQNQRPTAKTVHWMLDLFKSLETKYDNVSRLLEAQIKENKDLESRLKAAREDVIEAVNNVLLK